MKASSRANRCGSLTVMSLVLGVLAAGCSSTGPKTTTPTVASVVVSPAKDTLLVGAGVQLSAAAYDASNTLVPNQTFTWSSDMPGVASVSGTGAVQAVTAGGPVHIMAMDGSISGVAVIVDTAASVGPPATVKVVPSPVNLAIGGMQQLTDTVKDAAGNVINGLAITWSTANAAIATVSATGLVTAVGVGGPIAITATATASGKMGSSQVTVTPGPPATVKVVPSPVNIPVNGMQQLTDTIKDASGNVINGLAVTWSTANAAIATVSATGLVTGVGAGGPIAITATATASGKMGSSQVTVTPAAGITYASISAGYSQTCAVTPAGVGYCWGAGAAGQLGDNSYQGNVDKPFLVSGGHTWAVIRAGGTFSCGVTTAGTPYCWGVGPRLGDNSNTGTDVPVAVAGSLTVDSLSSGNGQSCARASGQLYCWGDNSSGQIGDDSTSDFPDSTPRAVVQGGAVFKAVSAHGDFHVCALTNAGSAYCWGSNSSGQLGSAIGPDDSVPVLVSGGLAFTSIATGGDHSCGVATNGSTYCWGYDAYGQLGDGGSTFSNTPVLVQGGHTFTSVVAGSAFSCGLTAAGAAWCWGNNGYGQAGQGNTTTPVLAPVAVTGGLTFTTITAGSDFVCGLVASGAAYCWGDDTNGQLGNGSVTNDYATPQLVIQP
jgi:alpha-tubulin suppressor-like RCC1 family protein